MKKFLLYLSLLFTLSGFAERLDYSSQAEKIKYKTLQKLKNEFDFNSVGGGGAYQGNVNNISMMLRINQFANIESARSIYLYFINEFVKALNADVTIRPYLNHFPADQDIVELSLLFTKSKENNSSTKSIDHVALINDNVVYFCNYTVIHKEPYKEALRIVLSK